MSVETQIFGVVLSLAVGLGMVIIALDREQIGRLAKKQRIVTFLILEISKENPELRRRLSDEISKLIEMNGD